MPPRTETESAAFDLRTVSYEVKRRAMFADPGAMGRIAETLGVTRPYVHYILYCRRRLKRVKALQVKAALEKWLAGASCE